MSAKVGNKSTGELFHSTPLRSAAIVTRKKALLLLSSGLLSSATKRKMQLSECVQACTHKQITQEQFHIWCLRENKQLHLVLLGQHEGNMTKTLSRTFGGISEMFHPLLLQAAAFGLSRRESEKHPARCHTQTEAVLHSPRSGPEQKENTYRLRSA